ncbi:GntR family transcriptional regulator [Actinoplanes sp. NPDC051851]|uniref:GntR family transcriptional regulator n=1 Tax=Actinoplanes sp. NPDC051851 TaxID=3154753 RepID=UPI0034161F8A
MSDNASHELTRLLKLEERREPAVAQVAIWVGLGIVEGRLRPGQDLNSVDLANRFQSSRTPVREALMLLESEGLVEIRARKRPRVASFTPERVQEIYFVRRHLLALMGSLVTQRVTDEELADLRLRLDRMLASADAGDVDAYFWGHVDLQGRLLAISGNQILAGILDTLALRTLVLRHASLAREGRLKASAADQVRIMDAIASRDGELASILLSRATDAALSAIDLSALTPTDV